MCLNACLLGELQLVLHFHFGKKTMFTKTTIKYKNGWSGQRENLTDKKSFNSALCPLKK